MKSSSETRRASSFESCSEYINYLQQEFCSNLDREVGWPPSQEPQFIFGQCVGCIKYLYFKDRDGLDSSIRKFRTRVCRKQSNAPLNNLLQVLRAQRNDTLKKEMRKVSPIASIITSANETFDARFLRQIESARTSFSTTVNTSFNSSIFSHQNESAQTSFTEASQDMTINPLSTLSLLSDIPDVLMSDFEAELPVGQEQEINPTSLNGNVVDLQARHPLEHWHIRELPGRGLFVEDLPAPLFSASPQLRYECVRIARSCNVRISELADRYTAQWEDYNTFWRDIKSLFAVGNTLPTKTASSVWDAAGSTGDSANVIKSGSLSFQTGQSDTIFALDLLPLKRETKTCRFFRKFNASRFLKLIIPTPRRLPRYLLSHRAEFEARLQEWLVTPDKRFLGWSWSVFFARHHSNRDKLPNGQVHKSEDYHIYLFATQGNGLKYVSLEELLDWFIPIRLNLDMTFCKVFARLELGFSQTYPTLTFKPSQVIWVGNKLADGSPEDRSLNDDSLVWFDLHDNKEPKVMNDGCSLISQAAARQVWQNLHTTGPVPSAFQARIGPWKGVWMLASALYESQRPGDIWIEVADSQRKFVPHVDDKDESKYDPERLTFEVLSWARTPVKSNLYMDYLPILENRGVSRHVLKKFVEDALEHEKDRFLSALKDEVSLLKWIQDESFSSRAGSTASIRWRGDFPWARGDRAKMLLESGFQATQCKYLLDLVKDLASTRFTRIGNSLKVPVNRSTNVLGVADLSGILRPNEIHLSFSKPFLDELKGASYQFLHNEEVLVGRHPALRPSDIQKVRTTFNVNLSHLVDVVVFPITGSFPLAGKLQGGDYDGDMFWVCWDPTIVGPFRNAPFHPNATKPEDLGISVDRTKLSSIFCDRDVVEHHCDPVKQFYRRSFAFQWKPQYLGICTDFFDKLCYNKNSINSPAINFTADLHDFLVDSAKNGMTYNESSWNNFIHNHPDVDLKSMSARAYKTASTVPLFTNDQDTEIVYKNIQIIDYLVFEVVRPRARKIINEAKSFQLRADFPDGSPTAIYFQLIEHPESDVRAAIKALLGDLHDILTEWNRTKGSIAGSSRTEKEKESKYDEAFECAHERYIKLKPRDPSRNPEILMWTHRVMDHIPTKWDLIKASAVSIRLDADAIFVLGMAGYHICFMKAFTSPKPNFCTPSIFAHMKMRKLKRAIATDDSDDNAEGGEENDNDRESHGAEPQKCYDTVEEMSQRMASSHLGA